MTNLTPIFQLAVAVHKDRDTGHYHVSGDIMPKECKTLKQAEIHIRSYLALLQNSLGNMGIKDNTL